MSDRLARLADLAASDPAAALTLVAHSAARNVAAESWFYAMLAAMIALGVTADVMRRRDLRGRYLSRSVRVDVTYGLLEIVHVVQIVAVFPAAAFLTWAFRTYLPWATVDLSHRLSGWAQLLLLFVVTDFVTYWWHRLQHESRIVWQFHKTHHSQRELNVLTTFRATIIDRLVALLVLTVPAALMQVDAAMPFALVAVLTLHQLLLHSDTGLRFGPFERWFVSPSFHEVHHSSLEPHLDRNYGAVLAIWDHLFGTYAPRGDTPLRYGLVGEELPESYLRQQLVPIAGLARLARKRRT